MKRPKVTIILTSHNRPVMLREAIQSIFNQTEKNWELIIIDDYSTVDGVNAVLEWAHRDRRVRIFKTDCDVDNLSILWNKGIDFSRGKYIALLDDDNKKYPTFVEEMSRFLDNNKEYYAVSCFAEIVRGNERSIFDMPKKMTKRNILQDNYVDSGCMMFRKSLINEIGWFDERLNTSEDWDYVIRILLQTRKGFGLIPKPLVMYRWHGSNRLKRAANLGDIGNRKFITEDKNYNAKIKLLLFHQNNNDITLSQNNVLTGIYSALKEVSFLDVSKISCKELTIRKPSRLYDMIFVFAPFSIEIDYIKEIVKYGREIINYHIEDPQAINENMIKAEYATYIFSNDISVIDKYKKVVGSGKVGFCPSVSYDDINLKIPKTKPEKKVDVMFYGYGYESRKKFVSQLIPSLKRIGCSYVVVGGGWDSINKRFLGEATQQKSVELMRRAKIVLLYNRRKTDLGGNDNSIEPESIVRGYFESAVGSLVMIDDTRKHHSFDDNIVLYSDLNDLIEKINYYLKNDKERERKAKKAQKRALEKYTYRKRMRQLINSVRSQRFWVEIE